MQHSPLPSLSVLRDSLSAGSLNIEWQLCESTPDAWAGALDAEYAMQVGVAGVWLPAQVPGTVAGALHRSGRYDSQQPRPLHDADFWYRGTISGEGCYVLQCEGLATLTEIYLDGQLLASSFSMFLPLQVSLNLAGASILHLVFRSLHAHLDRIKPPRAHWRVAMVPRQTLRAVRTTLLGHMPSWCPDIHTVGPWQGMRLIPDGGLESVRLLASMDGEAGVLTAEIDSCADLSGLRLACGGATGELFPVDGKRYRASLAIDRVALWWPRGMGEQKLHDVTLHHPQGPLILGRVGFRSIELDRGKDGLGFALVVNGCPFFARGVVYTPPEPLHPGGEQGIDERLQLLAEMGANLIRVAGPFCYESTAFYRQCDALGLLVWQDLMLANFDYPLADEPFSSALEGEIEALLNRLAGSPSLTVLCGGSEIHQQASMLGLSARRQGLEFYSERLSKICHKVAPGLIVFPNSPWGGDLPFSLREGVCHYFGVGAYERPLDDARRASPRFITECLAFANVPEPISQESMAIAAVHHPAWKTGVPRDRGASWDFEDTRDHYLERVFGLHPANLRRCDPAHYLSASRALAAHIMSVTLAEWRRPSSSTRGALVFTAGDLQLGAGWGLIDSRGEPKAPYYGFRQVAQALALFLTDEGCDGLDIHLVNDTHEACNLLLEVCALRHGALVVSQGSLEVNVAPNSGMTVAATRVIGAFFDLTYAFRFGAAGHDTVVVTARQLGNVIQPIFLQACYFPLGPYLSPGKVDLQARALLEDGIWWLELATQTVARFVHIDDRTHRPQDNYFHLPPGPPRRVRLLPRGKSAGSPEGMVGALNAQNSVHYRG